MGAFRFFIENQFLETAPTGKKRIAIFDFDGTLVDTPTPEEGAKAYTAKTGKPWYINDPKTAVAHGFPPSFKRLGWWGRTETLENPDIFQATLDKLNQEVAQAFHAFKDDPETYVIVMTGRTAKFEQIVKNVLANYHIHADEYFFKTGNADTFVFKANTIIHRIMSPETQSVEIFDDRDEHISQFIELGRKLLDEIGENLQKRWPKLESVTIHDVLKKQNHVLRPR
jgi:phosphoglycolate phosphatase-like HAD superfamily hydrolase